MLGVFIKCLICQMYNNQTSNPQYSPLHVSLTTVLQVPGEVADRDLPECGEDTADVFIRQVLGGGGGVEIEFLGLKNRYLF